MKIRYIIIISFFLTSTISNCQNFYSFKYKLLNLKQNSSKDMSTEFTNIFLESMTYNFESNDKIIYLKNVSTLEKDGVQTINSGETKLYINYLTKNVCYNIETPEFFTFTKTNFMKDDSENPDVLGLKTTKYISTDGNLIIYTARIPWYIQPCILNHNQFNEGVVKFENLKMKYGFELIEFTNKKEDSNFNKVMKSLIKVKNTSKNEKECPFFKLN